MRRLPWLCLVSFALCFGVLGGWSFSMAAQNPAPVLSLSDEGLAITVNGKTETLSPEEVFVLKVQNSSLRAAILDIEQGQTHTVSPGFYFFDKTGKMATKMPDEEAEYCNGLSLSPGGKVVAIDSGTSTIRSWTFYNYPEMTLLGSASYFDMEEQPLLWTGDNTVILTSISSEETRRQCDYDPCGPTSVEMVTIKPFGTETLFAGTELCDYAIDTIKKGVLTVKKSCAETLEQWKDYDDPKRKMTTVKKNLP